MFPQFPFYHKNLVMQWITKLNDASGWIIRYQSYLWIMNLLIYLIFVELFFTFIVDKSFEQSRYIQLNYSALVSCL